MRSRSTRLDVAGNRTCRVGVQPSGGEHQLSEQGRGTTWAATKERAARTATSQLAGGHRLVTLAPVAWADRQRESDASEQRELFGVEVDVRNRLSIRAP